MSETNTKEMLEGLITYLEDESASFGDPEGMAVLPLSTAKKAIQEVIESLSSEKLTAELAEKTVEVERLRKALVTIEEAACDPKYTTEFLRSFTWRTSRDALAAEERKLLEGE